MAEFLWTFAAQELLKKTVKLAAEQIGLATWGFKKELSKLNNSLLMLQAILRDVDRIKSDYPDVKPWVEKLQELVFEADVVLDELAYEDLRRKVEIGKDARVRDFFSSSKNPLVTRFKLANRIKNICKRLLEHYSSASVVGLVAITTTPKESEHDVNQIYETDSFLDEFGVIGRDEEVLEIVSKLIEFRNQEILSVLPIVGMGGLGKTALAKVIFNHDVIRENFDRAIWVCVSEPFVINKILRAILETLNSKSGGLESKEGLLQEIQKLLQDKNYFLVLDDVWNENDSLWNELKSCLLKITKKFGNAVVVTSRSDEVAKIMETHPRHYLKRLSNDHCWSLFEKCAFGNDLSRIPMLDKIRLVENFGGIPLVVKVLGGTVKFDKNFERLESELLENLMRVSSQDENRVLSTIKLSVDRLPSPSLKQCFAYCSNFPQDFEFRKEALVQMWIAQGFIQSPDERNVTMEDVGDKYFNILLSRSLFQDVVKDKRGRIIYCKMHDFIHGVACAISTDGRIRTLDCSDNDARRLHMLAFSKSIFHNKVTNFIYLRVLITHSWHIQELPDSISNLKHLRYLDISFSSITKLPKSLVLLYNLQTLKLARFIKALPEKLSKLVSLRHLEFYIDPSNQFKQMPQYLGRLAQLQTLPSFIAMCEEGYKIEELGPLKNLKGDLSLLCLEQVRNKKEAMAAKLVEKEHIYYLDFKWTWKQEREGSSYNDLDVLEGLQPHKNLQVLRIQNFASELLPRRIFVEKLVEIYLHNCERCKTLPMLGQLSDLEVLEIRNLPSVRRIGEEFYGSYRKEKTFFPKLKTFLLFEMKSLEHWEEIATMSTIFPHLESLSIICCPKLMNIPNISASGCKMMEVDNVINSKLRSLEILGCEKLAKLPDMLEFCSSLEKVWISNCSNLNSPPNLQNMHSLSCLSIRDLQKLPNGLANLINLKDLSIHGDLQVYDWSPLVHLRSLESLVLANSGNSVVQLPRELGHLTTLKTLHISHFDDVEALPEWFGKFTRLEMLKLYNCRNLRSLASPKAMWNVVRLRSLLVYGCSQFELGKGRFEPVETNNGRIQFQHEIHIPFYW